MIFGIGTDITDNSRIEKILSKYPTLFLKKYFSEAEYFQYKNLDNVKFAKKISKLYSGKEAFFKAIGTGLRFNMSFRDIVILKDNLGKPYIKISGETLNYIEKNITSINNIKIHISLSDEINSSIAFVIIEKIDIF
ncbi:holo-ACP synthase [bacterium]|nr:holo-ACP synthase [bacterium]